ncbi:glycosyltransferase family 2 protein [Thalassobellus citreus]|uniref:glycosyltransferase family 2 protein n=1 Tax=Thalassobellus citreus TaxID=3367752 RepID=UPI0037BD0212
MTPFISVVIPLYNKKKYIKTTIESVLNQTFLDYEIIIINDGSTDGSYNIVNNIADPKIRIYSNKNKGLSYSRNYGIKKAKANYIAFLDADDLWMEDFLETIYNLIIKNNNYSVFATKVKLLTPNQTPYLTSTTFNINHKKVISNFFKLDKKGFNFSSLVIKKSVFKKVGYFDDTVNYGEEYDFYIRCFSIYNVIYYNDDKIYYRTGLPDQLTASNKNFARKIPDYEKYLNNNNIADLKNFLDFIHFELVVLFKMEKNYKLVDLYKKKINTSNLSLAKKLKYYLPTDLFYIIKRIYCWFSIR